jgi:glycosyltransferase involved in cell wall biosynthesis
MRIAMIGCKGIPASYGGVERAAEELSARLAERGHEVLVYCRPHYTRIKGQYRGVKLVHVPSLNTKHLDTLTHSFLCTLDVMRRNVDVVHFHSLGPSIFSLFPRLRGIKSIVQLHGLEWTMAKWGRVARAFFLLCEYPAVYFPNRTTIVGQTWKRYLEDKFSKEIIYLPNGVNCTLPKQPRRLLEMGVEPGKYILFVSRLAPQKGCHYLLRAFLELDPDMQLVIAGDSFHTGAYATNLRRMAAGNGKVLFLGYVYGEALEELFSNAYLYVHPAEAEGLSIALLEAMAFGNCVLASDIPENLEALQGHGYTFRSRDVQDLKRVMALLVERADLVEAKKKQAKEHVHRNYDWQKVVDQLEGLYASLLNNR